MDNINKIEPEISQKDYSFKVSEILDKKFVYILIMFLHVYLNPRNISVLPMTWKEYVTSTAFLYKCSDFAAE
jgi:hypothetical protein